MAEARPKQQPATKAADKAPPAGPHAQERLTDHEKTPGTGALPQKGQPEADVGPD
jgi:hypothetical protein